MKKWEKLLANWEERTSRATKKDQGSIWTPQDLSDWMADWLLEIDPQYILDPAAGGGNLLEPFRGRNLYASEIDRDLIDVLQSRFPGITVFNDFWSVPAKEIADAVIANPPYINSRFIDNKDAIHKELQKTYGTSFPKSSNLAVLFYLRSWEMLRNGGRMIFLVPTEFMQINSGAKFKKFLVEQGCVRHIVDLDSEGLFGNDVISTACLVLAEKTSSPSASVLFSHHSGRVPFPSWQKQEKSAKAIDRQQVDSSKRWIRGKTKAHSGKTQELAALLEIKSGHITGDNKFFIVSPEEAKAASIEQSLQYILLRTHQLPTEVFHSKDQVKAVKQNNEKRFLVDIGPKPSADERHYIRQGESAGIHQKPTFAGRTPWWEQNYDTGYDFIVPNFRRSRYNLMAYLEKDKMAPTPFPTIQNPAYIRQEHADLKEVVFAWLLSTSGQQALMSNERHAGNGLYTIRSGAIKKVQVPLLQTYSQDWKDEMKACLWLLRDAIFAGDKSGQTKASKALDAVASKKS